MPIVLTSARANIENLRPWRFGWAPWHQILFKSSWFLFSFTDPPLIMLSSAARIPGILRKNNQNYKSGGTAGGSLSIGIVILSHVIRLLSLLPCGLKTYFLRRIGIITDVSKNKTPFHDYDRCTIKFRSPCTTWACVLSFVSRHPLRLRPLCYNAFARRTIITLWCNARTRHRVGKR